MELIIIKTNETEKVKKFLQQEHINYEIQSIPEGQIYQAPNQNWEAQEKKAFQEWQNLTDKELITEWEQIND
jgi:hypothetical protein